MHIKRLWSRIKHGVLLLGPFLMWVSRVLPFYKDGEVRLIVDAQKWYVFNNYYLNHISRGVYPLWQPFTAWGRSEGMMLRAVGEFNPFLTGILLLKMVGLPFSLAYFIYLIVTYGVCALGMYCLASRIFGERRIGYLAYLLLLFSMLSGFLFVDTALILVLSPVLWFFYFLMAFMGEQRRGDFLGLTFALMIIAVTYLPFYFTTVLILFVMGWLMFYGRQLGAVVKKLGMFICRHKGLSMFCCAALIVSVLPGLFWYLDAGTGESAVDWRTGAQGASNMAKLTLKGVNVSSIIGYGSLRWMFSFQDKMDSITFFIPVWGYILLAMGLIVPLTRRAVLFASMAALLLLIGMTDAAPIHRFLFEHVFFFRLFRNLHYFLWFSVPLMILLMSEQMQGLLRMTFEGTRAKVLFVVYTTLVHVGCVWFLTTQEHVLPVTFWTVGMSYVFFCWVGLRKAGRAGGLVWLILLITVIQPMVIYRYMTATTRSYKFDYARQPYTRAEATPVFSYTRPAYGDAGQGRESYQYGEVYDTDGFTYGRYAVIRSTPALRDHVDPAVLREYVRHKFYVYDHVAFMSADAPDWEKLTSVLRAGGNLAFVSDEDGVTSKPLTDPLLTRPLVGETDYFRVTSFDLNHIRMETSFPMDKFLVYNDSYHSAWLATVNGEPVKLYRANTAFKGVWLPAGQNEVVLRYLPVWRQVFPLVLLFLFNGLLVAVIIFGWIGRRSKNFISAENSVSVSRNGWMRWAGRSYLLYIGLMLVFIMTVDHKVYMYRTLNYFNAEGSKVSRFAAGLGGHKMSRPHYGIRFFRNLVKLYPDSAAGYAALAFCYVQMDDMDRSEIYYTKAVELAPELFGLHYNLGYLALKREDYAAAYDAFQRAVETQPQAMFVFGPFISPYLRTEPEQQVNQVAQIKGLKQAVQDAYVGMAFSRQILDGSEPAGKPILPGLFYFDPVQFKKVNGKVQRVIR